jgi:hypothetical protein
MHFALDVSNFIEKTKANADVVVRKFALEALSRLVMKTPVRTGCARGNWNVSIGEPDASYDLDKTDPQGDSTISEGLSVVEQALATGPSIFITNNLPYIMALEYGWSKQAPAGMLRVTVQELQSYLGAF